MTTDIHKMEFWGVGQICQHTQRGRDRIYQLSREADFPKPALVLSVKQKAYHRSSIIKWWAARQKKAG